MASTEGFIQLTAQERREVCKISRDSSQPSRVRLRATIILMSAESIGANRIAKATGACKRVVHDARRRWREQAFEGMYDRPRTGRPPRADERYRRILGETVRTDPRNLGYAFAQWTAPRLAEYLKRRTGIGLCDDWVRQLIKSMGFVWRKTKLTIRNHQDSGEKNQSPEAALGAPGGRSATKSVV